MRNKTDRLPCLLLPLFAPGEGVVVALSGGADSVALLALLREVNTGYAAQGLAGLHLYAAHVHHGLRAAADADAEFVRGLCVAWDVPLRVFSVDVRGEAARRKAGTEETARRLRYAALQEAAALWGAQKIATGHNRDDNAETVMMNLCRGAGLRGLGGMAPVSGNIIRPLLGTGRAEIEAYLSGRGIAHIADETNATHDFTRNRVRHVVLPAMRECVNAQAAENIARNAAALRTDAEFLETAAQAAFNACHYTPPPSPSAVRCPLSFALRIPPLLALHDALKTRVIRGALARAKQSAPPDFTDIHAAHIAAVLDIAAGQTGREARLPGVTVRRAYDLLLFDSPHSLKEAPPPGGWSYPIEPGVPRRVPELDATVTLHPKNTPPLPCTRGAEYVTLADVFFLRTRRPGDRIRLPAGTKKLQDFFTDKKIPRHRRDCIPLVAEGSTILWVDGVYAADCRFRVTVTPNNPPEENMHPNESVEILIPAEEINARLQTLADEIIRDYGDKPIILLCALTGGVIFLTDLSRKLGNNATLDFVRASSYGDGTFPQGEVKLDCHPKLDLRGKDVLLVEDIIDTGHTLAYLKRYLHEKGARVRVCALLDKPSRREVDVHADYLGFTIPDQFVVGYGLDYAQRYRNLPFVGVLKFTE